MKLLNEKNQFIFIKNGQVKIDSSLLKYQGFKEYFKEKRRLIIFYQILLS